ncbi:MAG: division/cell wall cluster transcriptional repressor MraZ [Pirellulaceae bacterium]|nr:division/cell wall cluster transcriptional repressor MraZ [Pirellulaceae bacterium]
MTSGNLWQAMFLTGSYQRSLDDKHRFTLPKTLRDVLEQAGGLVLYIAPGTDRSLVIYTESAFQRLGEQLGQGPPTAQDIRAFSRLFYAQAQRVEPDRQGRIRIPSELASLALGGRDIVLLGVRDHLEVWDRDRWQGYLGEKQPFYDEIAESAFGGGGQAPSSTGAGPARQPG